ncbi:MAG: hypothetical protein A2Y16_06940 [Tenericutes bacterium GWF2_57_13]|nr:MAG: hypothetical protein A2Y16_06940 [Tenericutes bacterium GWF2_57_13]
MGSLFDLPHLLYIVISLGVTVLLLIYAKKTLVRQPSKDRFLKMFGLLTFFLHVSVLWVDFIKNGAASVPDNVLFPIYFCNLSMYMLLLTAFVEDKESKFYRFVSVMTAYGGFFGAMISLMYPTYYLGSASMFEWGVFKSMTSHSAMLVGSLWLFVGGYVPIRKSNTFVYFGGLLLYGGIGLAVNAIFASAGLHDPNAMYLSAPPLSEAPFLSCWTIAGLMILSIHGFTLAWQKIAATREERGDAMNHEGSVATAGR